MERHGHVELRRALGDARGHGDVVLALGPLVALLVRARRAPVAVGVALEGAGPGLGARVRGQVLDELEAEHVAAVLEEPDRVVVGVLDAPRPGALDDRAAEVRHVERPRAERDRELVRFHGPRQLDVEDDEHLVVGPGVPIQHRGLRRRRGRRRARRPRHDEAVVVEHGRRRVLLEAPEPRGLGLLLEVRLGLLALLLLAVPRLLLLVLAPLLLHHVVHVVDGHPLAVVAVLLVVRLGGLVGRRVRGAARGVRRAEEGLHGAHVAPPDVGVADAVPRDGLVERLERRVRRRRARLEAVRVEVLEVVARDADLVPRGDERAERLLLALLQGAGVVLGPRDVRAERRLGAAADALVLDLGLDALRRLRAAHEVRQRLDARLAPGLHAVPVRLLLRLALEPLELLLLLRAVLGALLALLAAVHGVARDELVPGARHGRAMSRARRREKR
mmetsp:Transcript_34917/g.118300  ORF Transcript_34917/g.118300 Transcript_34917/m.118300 type:complete len:446 (-) Transcript_34917:36-1373(-)